MTRVHASLTALAVVVLILPATPSAAPVGLKLVIAGLVNRADPEAMVYVSDIHGHGAFLPQHLGVAATFSPNGREVAYITNNDAFVAAADGTGARRLRPASTDSTYPLGSPSWAPDGDRVVFACLDHTYAVVICVADVRTGIVTRIPTHHQRGYSEDSKDPKWSPAGDRLVFEKHTRRAGVVTANAKVSLWTMRPDGTTPKQIPHTAGAHASSPTWSAHGTEIAYFSCNKIVVRALSGSPARVVARFPLRRCITSAEVAWSHSGLIAYHLGRGEWIWTLDPKTGQHERILHLRGVNEGPSLSWVEP